jgi:hypothetical protein
MTDDDTDIPVAPAWRLGRGYLCACPFCANFHWHGAPDDEMATHRLSHCLDDARGYRLVLATFPPPSQAEIERAERRATRASYRRRHPCLKGRQ